MAVNEATLYMNGGSGDTSYANNSAHQKIGIEKSLQVLEETLKNMFTNHSFPKCFKMADLGCSSGPNTLMITSYIKEKIEALRKDKNYSHSPEFLVFLNDLPQNDFNNLFKMLPFVEGMFVCGLPGSFYGRLLPCNSLNFVYSSFSLQWLSRVPEGVESNRENIHVATGSPGAVFEAYANQFKRDFSTFLRLRGEEMLPNGRMVLIFVGRSVEDPSMKDDCQHFTILANTLVDMIDEGLIKESDLHSFNIPIYTPCKQEVDSIVRNEGSFNLDSIEGFRVPWDAHVGDKSMRGEKVSNFIRAYTEPVLAAHFGSPIMDDLYQRYGKNLAHHLSHEEPSFFNFILSLTKMN